RIDNQRAPRPARKFVEVDDWTGGAPHLPQILQVDCRFQSLADVARGLAVPYHVGKVSRGVIERSHLNPRIVRGGDKRIARSEARADDAEPVVTLRFQPVETTARIDHALAHGIERAS